jgi:ferredoxin
MKRIAPQSSRYRASSWRRHARYFINTLEYYSFRFFGADNCPFGQSGAFALAALSISIVTGLTLLFFYSPSTELGLVGIHNLPNFSSRSFLIVAHRASADILVLIILLHLIRNWAGERFRGPRARTWIKGLIALPLVGIIGWSGYVLSWDSRAMVLAAWGRELAMAPDRWPIVGWLHLGSLLSAPIFSAGNQADLLIRIFALHIGGAILLAWLVMWHLRKVTPPRFVLPGRAWLVLIGLVLIVAQMMPLHSRIVKPFNLFVTPASVHIDLIIGFPLLFYSILGAPLLCAMIVIIWLGLALLPKLEPHKILAACVDEAKCNGCRLCLQDCPYGAIVMASIAEIGTGNVREIARVLPKYCSACGTCVGSCEPDAVELPDLRSSDVISRIDSILAGDENEHYSVHGGSE